jgi:hypothetical protein
MIGSLLLTRAELRILFHLIVIFCLLYAYELTNFNLSIDDEVIAFSPSSHFAEMGRWVHPLIRETLFPQPIVPGIGMMLFAVFLSMSYLYTIRMLGVEIPSLFHYILWAAYCLYPSWIAQLEFSANIIPLGVGVLAISMAATLGTARKFRLQAGSAGTLLLVSFLCAMAMGAYQSLLIGYMALSLGWYARSLLQTKEHAELQDAKGYFLTLTAVLALSITLWLIIAKGVMAFYGLEASAYGKSFINFDHVIRNISATLHVFLRECYLLYYGFWIDFGPAGWIFVSALLAGVFLAAKSLGGFRKYLTVLILIIVVFLPACIVLASGELLPLRTFIAAPLAFLIVLLLAYQSTRQTSHRWLVMGFTGLVALQGLYINSIYQARSWAVQKHDLLLATAINAEVMSLGMRKSSGLTEIDFHGFIKPKLVYPEIPTLAGGASFFEWDGGKPYRMVRYFHILGLDTYSMTTPEKREKIQVYYADMPAFPEKGYAKVVDNVVLVKLSE